MPRVPQLISTHDRRRKREDSMERFYNSEELGELPKGTGLRWAPGAKMVWAHNSMSPGREGLGRASGH